MYWNDYQDLLISKAEQGIQMPSIETLIMNALSDGAKLFLEQLVHFVAAHTAILPWEVNGRIGSILNQLSNEYKIACDETGCWYRV